MTALSLKSRLRERPLLVFLVAFVVLTAAVGLGYAMFLRTDYTTLFTDLRAEDASAIVAELDKRDIKYRLEDSGAAIAVPSDEADQTRIALAGSDLSERGIVGFELFDKSDMGLTNFAQKINYQRALQGELARTIMMMDGVAAARVHLALPEKTLFSDDREEPKAAVTVVAKTGAALDSGQVAGIQQLVAASVPDLPVDKVVILDEAGRVVSTDAVADSEAPAAIEEHNAVEQYYRARAKAAIEAALPGMGFLLRLVALPISANPDPGAAGGPLVTSAGVAAAPAATTTPNAPATTPAATASPSPESARDFALRVFFISPAGLNVDDQQVVRGAVEQAVGLNPALGDSLSFETGPINQASPPSASPSTAPSASVGWANAPAAATSPGWRAIPWLGFAAIMLVVALLVWTLRIRAGASRLSEAERDSFAERLSRRIAIDLEGADAVA